MNLSGAIAALPIFALGGKKQVTGPGGAQFGCCGGEQSRGVFEAVGRLRERALALPKNLRVPRRCMNLLVCGLRKLKAGVPVPLNEPDLVELPEEIRREMTFVPAETLEEVIRVAIPDGAMAQTTDAETVTTHAESDR